jgi:DMSO/TMAO reductase YedYZ molybdopterin-dependent catalytic subunit
MQTRRRFLTLALGNCLAGGVLLELLASGRQRAWAAGRKVLAKGTKRESLIHENPAALDTTNLEITPLEAFGTMGPTDEVVDLATWRLEISGQVKRPLRLPYAQLTALPPVEREVLLICPGFFANHGRWRGFSLSGLLQQADFDRTAARIVIRSNGEKETSFPMAEVLSDKLFLAYQVNGKTLPQRDGFPVRVVAEGHYGSDWVKYVDGIVVERS